MAEGNLAKSREESGRLRKKVEQKKTESTLEERSGPE